MTVLLPSFVLSCVTHIHYRTLLPVAYIPSSARFIYPSLIILSFLSLVSRFETSVLQLVCGSHCCTFNDLCHDMTLMIRAVQPHKNRPADFLCGRRAFCFFSLTIMPTPRDAADMTRPLVNVKGKDKKRSKQKDKVDEACRLFSAGKCTRGDRCRYRHKSAEGSTVDSAVKGSIFLRARATDAVYLSPWNLHCRVEGPARMCLVLWMVIVRVRLLRVNGER